MNHEVNNLKLKFELYWFFLNKHLSSFIYKLQIQFFEYILYNYFIVCKYGLGKLKKKNYALIFIYKCIH